MTDPNRPRSFAVERVLANGTVLRLGTVSWTPGHTKGYLFFPNSSSRRPSRKFHATLPGCLPSWVGYPHACQTREL